MPDVGERFDKVEQGLTEINRRVDEQSAKADEQFAKVGEQFAKVDERFARVDERFTRIDERFTRIDERFTRIDERFDQVDQRFNRLQILVEDNTSNIKLIAEVLAHHGTVLDQIKEAMEPLKILQPLFEKVTKDHEQRITALEQARR